jgi:hypothetical protein
MRLVDVNMFTKKNVTKFSLTLRTAIELFPQKNVLVFNFICNTYEGVIELLFKATTLYPGGNRSHDPNLQSPRWQAETRPYRQGSLTSF